MKLRLLALAAVAASLGLAIVVHADAPPDQYSIFQAQTPTITDVKGKLEWERFPERGEAGAGTADWATAKKRCEDIGMGWRLPTVKELLTLIDEDPHKVYIDGSTPYLYIDRNAFPTAHPAPYWTSSTRNLEAWSVDFNKGTPKLESTSALRFHRCVRLAP